MSTIDIVFDGPPGHESGRFVDVENSEGVSILIGEWIERPNGLWALRIPNVEIDLDPTRWCNACGAMRPQDCKCGPIAENE